MATQFELSNGEIVPVPEAVVAEGTNALVGFYAGQVARLASEAAPAAAAAPAAPNAETTT